MDIAEVQKSTEATKQLQEKIRQDGEAAKQLNAMVAKCHDSVESLRTQMEEAIQANPASLESVLDVKLARNSFGELARLNDGRLLGHVVFQAGTIMAVVPDPDLAQLRAGFVKKRHEACAPFR